MAELVGTAEAAQILDCSIWTVRRLRLAGRLVPAQKMPGETGAFLFHRSDVEALTTELAA